MSATAPPKLPRDATLRAARSFDVGTVLDEKYRIESLLGQGGMAVVVAAVHVTLGHRVAIKLLLPEAVSSPAVTERVLREARAAAALTSETVTRVLDIGALDSGEPYIVMERLIGRDFAQLLEESGPMRVADVATYLVQASEAVAEAHSKGIIHRDLKPSNLFLTRRPDGSPLVKLMDFGISKLVEEDPADSLTRTQESLGTPHYMSPEQLLSSRGLDTRTDVWALGVIVYRLLTGEYPFTGETTPAIHIAVASSEAPRLRTKRPDAPVEIEELVARCLAKAREQRLPSVQAFAATLLPFADADTRKRFAYFASALPASPTSQSGPVDARGLGPTAMGDVAVTRVAWVGGAGEARAQARRGVRRRAIGAALALALVAGGAGVAAMIARARQAAATARAEAAAASSAIDPEPAAPAAGAGEPSPASADTGLGVSAMSSSAARSAGLAAATPPGRPRLGRPGPARGVGSPEPPKAPPDPSKTPDPYGQRR